MHVECVVYDAFKYGAAGKGLIKLSQVHTWIACKKARKRSDNKGTFSGAHLEVRTALLLGSVVVAVLEIRNQLSRNQ